MAGPEFGPKLAEKRLLLVKTFYGLASSAARYHEHCSEQLAKLGFQPTKADSTENTSGDTVETTIFLTDWPYPEITVVT